MKIAAPSASLLGAGGKGSGNVSTSAAPPALTLSPLPARAPVSARTHMWMDWAAVCSELWGQYVRLDATLRCATPRRKVKVGVKGEREGRGRRDRRGMRPPSARPARNAGVRCLPAGRPGQCASADRREELAVRRTGPRKGTGTRATPRRIAALARSCSPIAFADFTWQPLPRTTRPHRRHPPRPPARPIGEVSAGRRRPGTPPPTQWGGTRPRRPSSAVVYSKKRPQWIRGTSLSRKA